MDWYIDADRFLTILADDRRLQKISDLPTVDELRSAGLIDGADINASIFGTGKFYKEKQENKNENIYSNIDEMLTSTLKSEDEE